MNTNLTMQLINNVAMLMALSIVYEISYLLPAKWKKRNDACKGVFIGLIGVAIMSMPFQLSDGLFFDTRTILMSVTALLFGWFPAAVAAVITIIYRIMIGGSGTPPGIATITVATLLGLLWRYKILKDHQKYRWLTVYLMGLAVHVGMLACMFTMPLELALSTLGEISLPVMVIYPVGTVLLSLLLFHQKERNEGLIRISEAEQRYKSLFENNHAVMLLVDPANGAIIDANPAACRFYGWPLAVMRSMHIAQINTLAPTELKQEIEYSIAQRKNHFLFRHRRAGGETIDVEVYSGPIVFNGKTLLYSIVHDVSQRIAADRALGESEKRFRLLVQNAPEAIFIQTDGNFIFLNKAALTLFGGEGSAQLLGQPVRERFYAEHMDSLSGLILHPDKKYISPVEEIFIRLDGQPVYADVSAVAMQFDEKESTLVFARDITERRQLENAHREMEAQLRQQQKLEAIGTLAGGVAHEINNPINGIMNYAQLILDQADTSSAQTGYAGEIIHETQRVSAIVKNLLQFSRQEKQEHSYASPYDIFNQTLSLIKTIFKRDQIKLEVELEEGLPDIKCRSQQIQQVLMNLLTNARDALNEKYSDFDEDKVIRMTCRHYIQDDRRWLCIIVEDYGLGISPEIQEKIFEPFFSTKPKDKGTGLGLSISFGIVKDHHGTIHIESEAGKYTRFIVHLPVDNGWKLEA